MCQKSFARLLLVAYLILVHTPAAFSQKGQFAPPQVSGSKDNPEAFQYRPPVNKTSAIKGPVPSNRWWSALLVRDEVKMMSPFPLFYGSAINEYPAEGEGFGITVAFKGQGKAFKRAYGPSEVPLDTVRSIETEVQPQFLVWNGAMQRSTTKSRLHAFGDWHIVTETADQAGTRFYTTMTAGSPFTYFEFVGGQPRIRLNSYAGLFDVWNAEGKLILREGERYVGDRIMLRLRHPVSQDPTIWAFFAAPGTEWQRRGEYLQLTLGGGTRYLHSALMPSLDSFGLFYEHAYAKIIGTRADYAYDEERAEVKTVFRFETDVVRDGFSSEPLTSLFPHQYKNLPETLVDQGSYRTMRGTMKLWTGSSFEVVLRNQGVLMNFEAPLKSPGYSIDNHKQWMVWEDYVASNYGVDTYGTGKAMLRAGQSLALAKSLGLEDLHANIRDGLYREFSDWFTYSPGAEQTFWGDQLPIKFFTSYPADGTYWGNLVGWRAGFGTQALNDIHLHYGYWVYAAAFLARYHPTFVEDYGWAVDLLIRNMASPYRQDPQFPYTRSFDPYAGRSYANGFYWFGFYNGNDLESTSEALNAWQAIYQWGQITGQKSYRDLGLYLYWTERSAQEQYWLDVDEDVLHPDYPYPLVGILREGAYEFNTHWGSREIEELFGIQLLPLTPATLHLGLNRSYTEKIWSEMSRINRIAKTSDFNTWHGTMLNFQALVNPAAAAKRFRFGELAGLPGQEYSPMQDHETWSLIYNFIHNLNVLGRPIKGFYADAPAYGVFEKEGRYSFLAFNPSKDEARTVHFYRDNGELYLSLVVPPGETAVATR